MKTHLFSGPNRVLNPGQTKGSSVVSRLISLMQRIPRTPRIECKDAVALMQSKWKNNKSAAMFSFTGGLFEDNRLKDEFLYHTVAVLKTEKAYYIADPTYYQFKPAKDFLISQTAPNEVALLRGLQQIYGGKWYPM